MRTGIARGLILAIVCMGLASCTTLPSLTKWPIKIFESGSSKRAPARSVRCGPVVGKDLVYVVRKGDTLGEIGQCFKTKWYVIAKRNKIRDPNKIKVGQRLVIPARKTATARSSGGGSAPPRTTKAPSRAKSGITWKWPVKGKILRKFSPDPSGKQGIAISGKAGQPIVASAPGEVVYSGEGLVGYGRLLIIQHNKNFLSAYGHNDRLLVQEGQSVKTGQKIALMGETAAASPRLHFEIRYKGTAVDPLRYLP